MKIVLASRNKHKIFELETLLGRYIEGIEILSLDDVGYTEEIVEDGLTFEANAMIKAKAAAKSGYIGLGDDSGLSVRTLGGEPGIYSARYAGDHGNDAANNALLLEKMKDESDRYAEFVCAIACVFPNGEESLCVKGVCGGQILREPDGKGGFGYDPLFYYEEAGKTFAALTAEEKNEVSHRGRAVRALAEELLRRNNKNQ